MDRGTAEGALPRQLTLFDEPPPDAGEPVGAPLRRIQLGGRVVEYRFGRRRRSTIGITVDESGLAVAAPLRAPWREIEAFLRAKARWILGRLDEWAAAGRPRTLFGVSGERLPVLGAELTLEVLSGPRAVERKSEQVVIILPDSHSREKVRAMLVAWLKSLALSAFAPRAAHYAAQLGFAAPPLEISNARSQWGVCLKGGRIRLSWRLAHIEPALADYVIAHEVAHLAELNHSARFWALVEKLYPDWRAARERIELAAASIPRL